MITGIEATGNLEDLLTPADGGISAVDVQTIASKKNALLNALDSAGISKVSVGYKGSKEFATLASIGKSRA